MFKEDLDIFFNEEEFGTPAEFLLPDGSEFRFTVVFDDAFINPQTGLLSLDSTSPEASCKKEDVGRLEAVLEQATGSSTLPNQTIPLRGLPVSLPEAAPGKKFSILQVRPDISGTAVIILANE